MRKSLLILAFCCIFATPAWAGGGLSVFGAYAEVADNSSTPGFGGRISLGGDTWLFDVTGTWYQSVEGVVTSRNPFIEDKLQTLPVDLGVRYVFGTSSPWQLYLGGGGTLFFNNLNSGRIGTEYGLYGLLGLRYGKTEAKFYVEGIYRSGSGEAIYSSLAGDLRRDFDLGGFGVNFGVSWVF